MIIDDPRPPPSAASDGLPDYISTIDDLSTTRPPSYIRTPRPAQPLTYTFTHWTSDSMLLLPPTTTADLRPIYHISVSINLNPFIPISYVTTVCRGGSDQGEIVGSFELSLNQKRAVVTIGDSTTRLSNILYNVRGSSNYWEWNCGLLKLLWDCRTKLDDGSPMCVCYDGNNNMAQLASFVPPPIDASPPIPAAVITVFPDGHEFFDQILLSALVVERKWTLVH